MKKLIVCLILSLFSVTLMAATKTISLTPSRSGEQVHLQEDYLEYYTTYERRTSNEYGCLPEQVVRPVCRTLPPRTECGPRQWCTPTYYGPVCQTRVICGPVPGGSTVKIFLLQKIFVAPEQSQEMFPCSALEFYTPRKRT